MTGYEIYLEIGKIQRRIEHEKRERENDERNEILAKAGKDLEQITSSALLLSCLSARIPPPAEGLVRTTFSCVQNLLTVIEKEREA